MAVDDQNDSGILSQYDGVSGNMLFSWRENREGAHIWRSLTEDSLPFYAEYDGNWQEFLDSDAGAVWRDKVIPMCQINYESAGVILTDHINSLLLFNTGEASILEGRSFEAAEYASGEAVCLVSAAYALKNDLTVGDTINLDLYQAVLGYRESLGNALTGKMESILVQSPCRPGKSHRCAKRLPDCRNLYRAGVLGWLA